MQYMLDLFEQQIRNGLEATGKITTEYIDLVTPKPNVPADLALPCFRLAKDLKRNPADLAVEIAQAFPNHQESLVGKVLAMGPFLNFQLNPHNLLATVFKEIELLNDTYGHDNIGAKNRVIVEYSSPNIARKMNIGHLRPTIIGHATDNILEALGYEVISDNHLGDWGTQFGGLLYAYITWGFKPDLEHDPIKAMVELYARFNNRAEENSELRDEARHWFKRLEAGDLEAQRIWRWMIDLSISGFKRIYERLGIEFDHYYGESFYEPMLQRVIDEAIAGGIAQVEEGGAVSVSFGEKLPSYLIRTTDGRSLYQTRDIAAAIYRWETWQPVRNVYVVGQEQTLHFQQVFETLRRMGYTEIADRSIHIANGHIQRPEGGRFSMRKGAVLFLEDVLDEAVDRARAVVDTKNASLPQNERAAIAEAVGVGAVIYNDLYQDPKRNISFDWDRMLSFTGNSAPYIQMMHARCCSILREAGLRQLVSESDENMSFWQGLPQADVRLLEAEQELELVKQLARLPIYVRHAGTDFTPYTIAQWLYETSRAFSRFYDSLSVLSAESEELRNARLRLVAATGQSLRNGLCLLGIRTPERM